MKYVLDDAVRIGGTVVAILSRTKISSGSKGGFMCFVCEKTPIMVLTFVEGQTGALSIGKDAVTLEEVGHLCPGAVEKFQAACLAL